MRKNVGGAVDGENHSGTFYTNDLPIELRRLRVAAYCRVSTEQEEQTGSINWENAGIFSERFTGLNLQERPEFRRMIELCRKNEIDLILIKSVSRFRRNTSDMLQTLRTLDQCDTEVYFEQENIWLSRQHIQVLLAALW